MAIGFNTSVNGIRNALTTNSVRSNNIANINSKDFKEKRAMQTDSAKLNIQVANHTSPLVLTQNTNDVAIVGSGYIKSVDSGGGEHLSKSVTFSLDTSGNLLDEHGNVLAKLNLPAGNIVDEIQKLTISEDGSVLSATEGSNNEIKVGQLLIVDNDHYPGSATSKLVQGALIGSNVDLATQMTGNMIDEKVLKANVAAIKTKDEMLGEVIDLKG